MAVAVDVEEEAVVVASCELILVGTLVIVASPLSDDAARVADGVALSYKMPFVVATDRATTTGDGSLVPTEREGELLVSASAKCPESSGRLTERRVLSLLLPSRSLNETSSFCVVQEMLFKLKRAMRVTGSRLMLNFCSDWVNNVGKELPIVAFLRMLP